MVEIGGLEALDNLYSKKVGALAQRLDSLLAPDEPVRVIAQARAGWGRKRFLLALTNKHLLAVDADSGRLVDEAILAAGFKLKFEKRSSLGNALTVTHDGVAHVYRQVLPHREGSRIWRIATNTFAPEPRRLLPAGFTPEATGPLVSILYAWPTDCFNGNEVSLYRDRLVADDVHLPFGGDVNATADSAGNIAVTRGRNLAAKGAATLVTGPVGLFLAGNAKQRTTDTRELYLLVEGPTWSFARECDPRTGSTVRQFAQTINAVARQACQSTMPASPLAPEASTPQPPMSVADELAKLAKLKTDGVLNDEEFAAQKARLLAG
jgi:hypothetical protein